MNNLHSIVKIPQLNEEQLASVWTHLQDYEEGFSPEVWIYTLTGEVSYDTQEPGQCTMDHLSEWYDAGKPAVDSKVLNKVIFYE